MKLTEHPLSFGGAELFLTSQRAIYWPQESALILSDLHLGKAAHFRKSGIALPTTVSDQDLFRLQNLLNHYQPRQVIIVGDLIHAGANKEVELFKNLTVHYPDIRFILIRGNHDRHTMGQLKELGIAETVDTLQLQNIQFSHLPVHADIPTISGHIHPGVRIRMPHKKHLKLPCYTVTGNQLILPAFTLFSGLDTYSLPEKTTCYAIYEDRIFAVTEQ